MISREKREISPKSPLLIWGNSFPRSMCQHPPLPSSLTSSLPGLSPTLMPKTTNGQGNEITTIGSDQSGDFEMKANVSAELELCHKGGGGESACQVGAIVCFLCVCVCVYICAYICTYTWYDIYIYILYTHSICAYILLMFPIYLGSLSLVHHISLCAVNIFWIVKF